VAESKADSPAVLPQRAEHPRKTDFSLFERQGELRSKRKYPGVKNRARAKSEMQRQFFWEVAIPLQRVAVAGRLPLFWILCEIHSNFVQYAPQ